MKRKRRRRERKKKKEKRSKLLCRTLFLSIKIFQTSFSCSCCLDSFVCDFSSGRARTLWDSLIVSPAAEQDTQPSPRTGPTVHAASCARSLDPSALLAHAWQLFAGPTCACRAPRLQPQLDFYNSERAGETRRRAIWRCGGLP